MTVSAKFAHKLRNRIQVILTLIEMAQDDLPREQILKYLTRAQDLLENLSQFITEHVKPGEKIYLLDKDKK